MVFFTKRNPDLSILKQWVVFLQPYFVLSKKSLYVVVFDLQKSPTWKSRPWPMNCTSLAKVSVVRSAARPMGIPLRAEVLVGLLQKWDMFSERCWLGFCQTCCKITLLKTCFEIIYVFQKRCICSEDSEDGFWKNAMFCSDLKFLESEQKVRPWPRQMQVQHSGTVTVACSAARGTQHTWNRPFSMDLPSLVNVVINADLVKWWDTARTIIIISCGLVYVDLVHWYHICPYLGCCRGVPSMVQTFWASGECRLWQRYHGRGALGHGLAGRMNTLPWPYQNRSMARGQANRLEV